MIDPAWVQANLADLSAVTTLGEGGQKWVFSAVHSRDGKVVLKVIKPTQDPQRVAREIQAAQQVNSTRVPKTLDTGTVTTSSGDYIWVREQCVEGECLRAVLSRGPLSRDDTIRLGIHILEALADVERSRLVHRDIKPDNIIRDNAGDFWLIDFGIARHLDLPSLTSTAAAMGPHTVGYAPPEQYRNRRRDIDIRADLFALGVTLCECVTGRHPYRDGARDAGEVIRRIETRPISGFAVTGDARNEVRDFILTLVQRRPDHRIQTAADALTWLRTIAGGGP